MEASCSFGAGPSQITFERPRSSLPVTTRRIGLRLDAIERLLREIFQLVYQAVESAAGEAAHFLQLCPHYGRRGRARRPPCETDDRLQDPRRADPGAATGFRHFRLS